LLFLLALWRYKENLGRILEGTEPKLGDPLPLPSERQVVCAFLIHPLTVEDFWQSPRFRWMRPLVRLGLLKQAWMERLAELFRPMKVGEVRG
jgi:predicted amino acid dehydrogenase